MKARYSEANVLYSPPRARQSGVTKFNLITLIKEHLAMKTILAIGEFKVSACPIGGTFFDELFFIINSYILRAGPRNLLIIIY